MLNNNLYYFPPYKRQPLFSRLAELLAPGGHLAIQVPVSDERDTHVALFDLALSAFDYYFGLPTRKEIERLFSTARLSNMKVLRLSPFFAWKYFIARNKVNP